MMSKFLEDELKSSELKHCESCQCNTKDLTVLPDTQKTYTIGTQTLLHGDANNSLCLRCNSNLNSPSRTNSPYIMKLVKSSDSVISETKSSVSNSTQNEKLFTPAKKEELMVNPILGHHRICDRTSLKSPLEPLTDPADVAEADKVAVILPQTPGTKTPKSISSPDKGPGTMGSTNSLWSKTSSSEGNKMFETFNRNLIKTIKVSHKFFKYFKLYCRNWDCVFG